MQSVDERTYIDRKRRDKVTDSEWGVGGRGPGEGSTIRLEPNTEISIQRVQSGDKVALRLF